MKQAVFRFDAGGRIGLGHAMRARALADLLVQQGWRCCFAVNQDAGEAAAISDWPEQTVVEGSLEAQKAALRAAFPNGCDLLVVDNYDLDIGFEAGLRGWAQRIAVIDDLADRPHDCDLLIDPAPKSAAVYASLVPEGCRRLMGPWYAPIRPAFARERWRSLAHDRSGRPRCIAVSFGGGDNQRLTLPTLRAIHAVLPDAVLEVYAVGASWGEDAISLMQQLCLKGEVLNYVSDPAKRLASVDMMIGAAGVSVWERCVLGLPSLIVPTSDNQAANVTALRDADAAEVVGLPVAQQEGKLAEALAKITGDGTRRQAMSRAAALLCDGRGVHRIAAELDPPVSKLGKTVHLRRATMNDADLIFGWQCSPNVRRYFRNPQPPTEDEHLRWMATYLRRPDGTLCIIQHGAQDVGLLRLDATADGTSMEVSILVAPSTQGSGVGAAALKLARRIWPDVEFTAEVLPGNSASRAVFTQAGYTWTGEDFRYSPITDVRRNVRSPEGLQ